MASRDNLTPEQRFVFDYVDRNAKAIALTGDNIFYFGELGMQEFETAGLMTDLLEKGGFKVERGIAGFPTGFCATYGSGHPVVAIHTEYDSCPDNSQASGVPGQKFIVEGAPGHCEGHNVNAAVLVATALASKEAMAKFGLKGTLKVFGAPAEEQLVSRPYFVRDGWFDDVDLAFHNHIGGEFSATHGMLQSALVSATFTFHGETAHSGVAPWNGRDALDGVVLMDVGMAQYREHMRPEMRAHRVITNGGDQPNVIPRTATVWWFFRDQTAAGAMKLFEQAKKIAQGAALMSNTELTVDVLSAVWPLRCNRTACELLQRNIETVGVPEWSVEEEALARALQGSAKVKVEGLKREIPPLSETDDAAHLRERRRRRVLEGADGEVLLSVERAQHPLPSLGRRRRAGAFDRAQGRGGGIKGVCRGGGGVLLESGRRGGGQAHLQGGAWRRRVQVDAAGGPEAAGRAQSRHYGKISPGDAQALSERTAGVLVR